MAVLAPELRSAVLADIAAGELSCRAIAARHGVGRTTVSRIAREAGHEDAFDRTQTQAATEAITADCERAQAELRLRSLETAHELLDSLGRPVPVWAVGTDTDESGARTSRILRAEVQPGPADTRNLLTAYGIVTDKALAIARLDAEHDGANQASGMLGEIWEGLQTKQDQRIKDGFYDQQG